MRQTVTLFNPQQGHAEIAHVVWPAAKALLQAGHRLIVEVRTDTRTLAQNRLLWSCMTDLSEQVKWCGRRLTPEGWKEWLTGHLDGQELLPNMDGTGFISISRGRSTRQMTVPEMTAVIDLAHAFGAEQGVKWSQTSLGRDPGAPTRQSADVDPETGEVPA